MVCCTRGGSWGGEEGEGGVCFAADPQGHGHAALLVRGGAAAAAPKAGQARPASALAAAVLHAEHHRSKRAGRSTSPRSQTVDDSRSHPRYTPSFSLRLLASRLQGPHPYLSDTPSTSLRLRWARDGVWQGPIPPVQVCATNHLSSASCSVGWCEHTRTPTSFATPFVSIASGRCRCMVTPDTCAAARGSKDSSNSRREALHVGKRVRVDVWQAVHGTFHTQAHTTWAYRLSSQHACEGRSFLIPLSSIPSEALCVTSTPVRRQAERENLSASPSCGLPKHPA